MLLEWYYSCYVRVNMRRQENINAETMPVSYKY